MAAKEPFFGGLGWTDELGQKLQEEIDQLFPKQRGDDPNLNQLEFSFTIADPSLEGCPLVGCSSGFKTLCGYEMDEIIGRNCRFLVDPVPKEFINEAVRLLARDFCKAVLEGTDFRIDPQHREPWMPRQRPHDDGLFCVQTNARKNGDMFKNMFYLKKISLNDKPYIVGLQTELEGGNVAMVDACHKACSTLDNNMSSVERVLAGRFWLTSAMRRQENAEDIFQQDGFDPSASALTTLLSEDEKAALGIDQTTLSTGVASGAQPAAHAPSGPAELPRSAERSSCWAGCFGSNMVRGVS